MMDIKKLLQEKPIVEQTWERVTFFHEGERITWYFLHTDDKQFLWETGYEDEMWYATFEELCQAIRDYEDVMRSSL